MKTLKIIFTVMLALMAFGQAVMAQTYRSTGSGNWTSLSTWQLQDGASWVAATSFPGQTSTNAIVTIQASHLVYINPGAYITIKDINVEASGKVTLQTGGKIIIADKMQMAGSYAAAIVVDNTAPTGTIATLDCAGATLTGSLTEGTAAAGTSFIVGYTGGNSGNHFGQTVASTGVTGLTAVLGSGTFASGNGQLTYIITGTPADRGTATFALTIGGQTCNADFAITPVFKCGDNLTFIYGGSEVTYGTIVKIGLCWMDRNLGASRVATSSTDAASYGDLFQWGRSAEGHQVRANTVHYTGPVSTSVPNAGNPWDGKFITNVNSPYDWHAPSNPDLWQGGTNDNNPCPPGWRVPTEAEWNAERQSWSPNNNATGAFNSSLKLPVAGNRSEGTGTLFGVGSGGRYWSSTVPPGVNPRRLDFSSTGAEMRSDLRARGFSVRCLKD